MWCKASKQASELVGVGGCVGFSSRGQSARKQANQPALKTQHSPQSPHRRKHTERSIQRCVLNIRSAYPMSSPAPDNANEVCVGPGSESAGKASTCAGCPNQQHCAAGQGKAVDPAIAQISSKMAPIKHKILVLSGKGGVGKSTFSSQLAFAFAGLGYHVGLLDVDICGPSIPQMLGLSGHEVHQSASGWSPVFVEENLGVMSIGFMLPNADDAVIWRGPRKNGLIKQFLTDVDWGKLDYLIVDTPPGTSDEHISIVQLLKESHVDGAVIVTTPQVLVYVKTHPVLFVINEFLKLQEVSMADVRKELSFCKKTGDSVWGGDCATT